MASPPLPIITLAPPPGLSSSKAPPEFDMSMFPTIICAVICGFFFSATIWLHNSKKKVFMDDEHDSHGEDELHDVEHGTDIGYQDSRFHDPNLQPGPAYGGGGAPPHQPYSPQRSNRPSDWSHTIPTDSLGKSALYESGNRSGPSSSLSYSTAPSHTTPPSSGIGRHGTPIRQPGPRPIARSASPPPPLPPFNPRYLRSSSDTGERDQDVGPRAGWQIDNDQSDSGLTEWTTDGRGSSSRVELGSEYLGSVVTGFDVDRPLTGDYTDVGRGI